MTLSPRAEAIVRELVEGGRYADLNEVIEQALQTLDERDHLERLRAMLWIGIAFCGP